MVRNFSRRTKAVNIEGQEIKRVVRVVMDELYDTGQLYRTKKTMFQIDFYNFLKRIKVQRGIAPQEVLTAILQDRSLVTYVRQRRFNDFMSALQQTSSGMVNREIIFVSLFYDAYYTSGNWFGSVLKTRRYPLDKFDRSFIHYIFCKYPFLRDRAHLEHVVSQLSNIQYACLLLKNGIREEYNA